MKSVVELNDTELRQAYVYATRRYNDAYREKKAARRWNVQKIWTRIRSKQRIKRKDD